jgi:glycosyltransferase involved in cell wall biosynthesis
MSTLKCDILIYTNMPSNGWGGSEELWFLFAQYCVIRGNKVVVMVELNGELHSNFKNLSDLGICLKLINPRKKYSFIEKVHNKFRRWSDNQSNTPQHCYETLCYLKELKPKYFLINQGGTFNFIEDKLIIFLLNNFESKYILISQHNLEYYTYTYNYLIKIRNEINKFSKFFFVSERNYEVAKRQLAIAISPEIHFIQNPCKIYLNSPLNYPIINEIKIAFIGRLECRNKGLDVLIDALSDTRFDKFNWILELWGEGADKSYLMDLVKFHNLSNKILFKGFTSDVIEVWKTNEMLILPSYNEGTPLTILEAMMCSRAVFTTDVGDNGKYIKHQFNGYLVDYATKKSITENIELAFLNRKKWKDMGIQSWQFLTNNIKTNPEVELYEHIFQLD